MLKNYLEAIQLKINEDFHIKIHEFEYSNDLDYKIITNKNNTLTYYLFWPKENLRKIITKKEITGSLYTTLKNRKKTFTELPNLRNHFGHHNQDINHKKIPTHLNIHTPKHPFQLKNKS